VQILRYEYWEKVKTRDSNNLVFWEHPDFANRQPAVKIKRIDQGKKMSITPEEQLRLSACIDEIAQILYKNTDSAEISTLEGLKKVVRQQMLE